MKKFKFAFSSVMRALSIGAMLLTAAGIIFNIISVTSYAKISALKTVVYSFALLISFALFLLVLSLIFYGCYVIKDGYLYSNFGFIRTKVKVSEIVSLTHYKKSKKLVAFFKSAEYTVIIIEEEDYENFTRALKEQNPNLIFDRALTEEEDEK